MQPLPLEHVMDPSDGRSNDPAEASARPTTDVILQGLLDVIEQQRRALETFSQTITQRVEQVDRRQETEAAKTSRLLALLEDQQSARPTGVPLNDISTATPEPQPAQQAVPIPAGVQTRLTAQAIIGETATESLVPQTPEMTGKTTETPQSTVGLTGKAARLSYFRKEYNKYKALKFFGGTDVQKADDWMRSQEKIHRGICADEDLKVELSVAHLEGAADEWYQGIVDREGPIADWTTFRNKFFSEFFTEAMRNRKYQEFGSFC